MTREPATHDAFFKQIMAEVANVERLLAEQLPADLAALVVPGSVERLDGSFVDDELRRSMTDLLYGLRLRTGDGGERPAFAVLLLEHKSAPDDLTPLQLLRYEIGIWQRWLADGRGLPLPPVLAVVVHQGAQGWRASVRFEDLFGELPSAVRSAVPHFTHGLVDLVSIPDERLSDERRLRTMLKLMKYIMARDLDARLELLLHEAFALGFVEFRRALVYLDTNRARVGLERLRNAVNVVLAEEGDDAMGIWELLENDEGLKDMLKAKILAKAEAEASAKAKAKGMAEGKAEGKAELLCRLLERRFGAISDADRQRVARADVARIDTWGDRLFSAASLAEVLDG